MGILKAFVEGFKEGWEEAQQEEAAHDDILDMIDNCPNQVYISDIDMSDIEMSVFEGKTIYIDDKKRKGKNR